MTKKITTLFIVLIFTIGLNAQIVEITATQAKASASKNAELRCNPVKLLNAMKITKVEGDGDGLWIVKDQKTIHTFKDNKSAIGLKLEKGTYYIYPYLKKNKLTASVTVSLE